MNHEDWHFTHLLTMFRMKEWKNKFYVSLLIFWREKLIFVINVFLKAVLFISGKCKRFPRHLLFLLWFSWRFKIAEVNGNRAEQGSIYFCKHLHDKLLWPIGGVVCVYTSQLNGTAQHVHNRLGDQIVSISILVQADSLKFLTLVCFISKKIVILLSEQKQSN